MEKINILGVNLSLLKKEDVLLKIRSFLKSYSPHYIVTPNPEIVLKANKDEEYFYILNKADISLADGMGLKIAGWIMGKNIPRITGAGIIGDILKLSEERKIKTAIINWEKGLLARAEIELALRKKYPGLDFFVINVKRGGEKDFYPNLYSYNPEIILSALGAPWQEKFIYHQRARLPALKIGIGIGGALDFLTGKIKRSPKILRTIGLEWLWRLFKLPFYTDRLKRLKRIYTAVIIFPLYFIKWRFFEPFMYRPNVACIMYKKEKDKYYILIVNRQGEEHWQLPQGGLDGLGVLEAGTKELSEELNTKKFKPIAFFKNLYKYKFEYTRGEAPYRGGVIKRHQGYKGQRQGLFIAEFYGTDRDIKVNYWDHSGWKWVEASKLTESVHPCRRKATKIFLNKFNKIKQ